MTRLDAEKLLGGHAVGILTEEERKALYAAALEDQALFDALMDEEVLRELLTDPEAKARLLTALEPAAPKVVPFWRRTGVLGAAASLLVASLAGIAYLRSPDKAAPALRREPEPTPAAKVAPAPPAAQVMPEAPRKRIPLEKAKEAPAPVLAEAPAAPPPPAPVRGAAPAGGAPVAAAADAAREKEAEFRRAEARDNLAKKAEAPKPAAAAAVEVVASVASLPTARKSKSDQPAQAVAALAPGVVGGVVGGVAPRRVEWKAAAEFKPSWTLEPRTDGITGIAVKGPSGAAAVLLKRGAAGVEVVPLERLETREGMDHWRGQIRLAEGDALDLYLLNAPAPEPAKLPERGPVDGFRARIYPAPKN